MPCKINNNSNFDITEIEDLIQDLFSFSQNKHGFKKLPVLNLLSDESNSSPLGKTAFYDPNSMEITIYVDGRHPKDIMRSFSHELVHHNQNENGMFDQNFGSTGSGYAQSNPHLRKMEKEAYLKGNMCFRDWEDGYKSSNPNILNERRIYKMSTKDWKNKELNTLLNEKWGFSMNLDKLNESKEITHMCALKVTHKKSGKKGHPIKHTLTESGKISHYTVEFEDVIVENIPVRNLHILVQEKHSHKRDDEKEHDKKKKVVSEEELENPKKADLDKDGKLSSYEKKRGKAIEKSMKGQGKKELEEIDMGVRGGLGKTPKSETDAAKQQSDKNYAHMKKNMGKSKKKTQVMKEDEQDKKMGDNPEGVTELMAAINKLSEKESNRIYTMLRKKHEKKKINEQEETQTDNKLKTTSGGRYTTKDPELTQKVQNLAKGIINNPSLISTSAGIETIIQQMIGALGTSEKTLSQTKTDMAKVQSDLQEKKLRQSIRKILKEKKKNENKSK